MKGRTPTAVPAGAVTTPSWGPPLPQPQRLAAAASLAMEWLQRRREQYVAVAASPSEDRREQQLMTATSPTMKWLQRQWEQCVAASPSEDRREQRLAAAT